MKIMKDYKPEKLQEYKEQSSPIKKRIRKGILENSAHRYISQMKFLFGDNRIEGMREYWEWQAEVAKPVRCVSYRDVPGLKEKVEEFLKRNELVVKECYYNSMKVVWNIPGVEYVEGIAHLAIPIDHAWNCYKGHHFDLTAEIVLGMNVERFDYAQVVKLERRTMDRYASRTKVAGGYIAEYYKDNVAGR